MAAGRRAAFVTGGSSGIGLGLARGLLDSGYAVTIVARREQKLMDALEVLKTAGSVRAYVADFRSESEIEAAVAFHRKEFGRLDVLVNNAGVATAQPVDRMTTESIDLALDINLRAALICTRASIGMLLAAAPSHIFNIASLTALEPQAGMAAYASSKAGLVAFTDALRAEVGHRGVKAAAICPGFVDTAMADAVRGVVEPHELIPVSDVVEVVLTLLRLSPASVVPMVAFEGASGGLQGWSEVVDARLALTERRVALDPLD
jgi:NAD(P)-dependent dehydrogenase (short-subunit alcohol dehydrogenase family)